jgi:hypothetical protein
MEDVGHNVSPAARKVIAKLGSVPPSLTLEEAIALRTALGDAWARANDSRSAYVLNSARQELGKSIGDRFEKLGQGKAWDYRNRKFEASYDIQRNFTNVLAAPKNPYDSLPAMENFSKQNLNELLREMRSQGLKERAGQLETAKRDAAAIAEAHTIMSNRMGTSLFRLSSVNSKAALAGITAYVTLHPVAGLGAYMLGTMASNLMRKVNAATEAGRIGRAYPDAISSIQDSGPRQDFNFGPGGPGLSKAASSPAPAGGGSPAAVSPEAGSSSPGPSASPADALRFIRVAKANLGADASPAEVAAEASRLEDAVRYPSPLIKAAELTAARKARPTKLGFDMSFPTGPDMGEKVRAKIPSIPRDTERRAKPRSAEQQLQQELWARARKELGEGASSEQIEARIEELKKTAAIKSARASRLQKANRRPMAESK